MLNKLTELLQSQQILCSFIKITESEARTIYNKNISELENIGSNAYILEREGSDINSNQLRLIYNRKEYLENENSIIISLFNF